MIIRTATLKDLEEITAVEAECFPKAEAAKREDFEKRLAVYPDYFWLLELDGKIVSFINGMVTDEKYLRDEMYENASLHNEHGAWQMIFGVNTIPAYRRKGYAANVMQRVIKDAKNQGRKGIVLTCKDTLLPYYAKFGFVNEGISESTHGGVVWYNMRLSFS